MLSLLSTIFNQSYKNIVSLLKIIILCNFIICGTNLEILPISNILPSAVVGIPYAATFSIDTPGQSSNLTIFNLSIIPSNLTFQGNLLSGIPLRSGNFQITFIIASNNIQINSTQKTYIIIIDGITTNSVLPLTYLNVPFQFNITYIGGIAPFFYQLSNNPSWLRINNSTVFGTPDRIGNFSFLVTLNDSQRNQFSKNWTVVTQRNKIILNPTRVSAQVNRPSTIIFTASNGVAPYTYQFSNLPTGSSYSQNILNIIMSSQGSYTMGVYITDSTGMKNYFNVLISATRRAQNILQYIQNVTTSYTDNRTGQKITIFNVPPMDLIPGFVLQQPSTPSFNTTNITSRSSASSNITQSNSFIKSASHINNRSPCQGNQQTLQGSGTITSVNSASSTIQLNNRMILVFQNCTMQAFRGSSKTFSNGNFVSYQGVLHNNRIYLRSITNTS